MGHCWKEDHRRNAIDSLWNMQKKMKHFHGTMEDKKKEKSKISRVRQGTYPKSRARWGLCQEERHRIYSGMDNGWLVGDGVEY